MGDRTGASAPARPEMVEVPLRRRVNGVSEVTAIVQGELIAPGLAITPRSERAGFSLTHLDSGMSFVTGYCDTHIRVAAERTLAVEVDWTVAASVLLDDAHKARLSELAGSIRNELGFECRTRCYHGGVPSFGVRCNTCDWELDEDVDEWLDAEAAKFAAYDHRCEPDVQIRVPGDGRWLHPYQVNDDGTVPGTKAGKEVAGMDGD